MKGKVTFMSVAEFKAALGVATIEIVKNPNTGKLFVSAGTEKFKCQQDIDLKGSMSVLIPVSPDGEQLLEEACLLNVKETNNVLATL
jgi:hypothetical protein